MTHRTGAGLIAALLALIACNRTFAQFSRPLEFTMFPVGGDWMSFFAEDWEATTSQAKLRLHGPVKCVEQRFSMVRESEPDIGPQTVFRMWVDFDAAGMVQTLVVGDGDAVGEPRRFLAEHDLIAGRSRVVKLILLVAPGITNEPHPNAQPENPSQPFASMSYDPQGRLVSIAQPNGHVNHVHLDRNADGRLTMVRRESDGHTEELPVDEQGRVMMLGAYDAQWFERRFADWPMRAADPPRRAWIRFDERGTPVEWEADFMGPSVRYQQHVVYDEYGNWISLGVTASFKRRDGVEVKDMLLWTCEQHIEYTVNIAPSPSP